ncbi:hypothetical protein H6P81_000059 [Aristolochia fimbriata]|uniref:Uncharacterized protein n=1 Tax=Aristolochia fimbriata TaxID=158543 RepID=A0AAV7F6T6_ARIFI|nr:hypothetical protein H6P81_000059 [Aristolochia fimbriata]
MAALLINHSCLTNTLFITSAIFALHLLLVQGVVNSLTCESLPQSQPSDPHQYYRCDPAASPNLNQHCFTFALFYANAFYSSLSNLTQYLGFDRVAILEASGLSKNAADILLPNQPLLLPIDCRCDASTAAYFQAWVTKTAIEGETFEGIAASLEGLTTCTAIKHKNPNYLQQSAAPHLMIGNKTNHQLILPLICACPNPLQLRQGTRLLLSYPVFPGDTVSKLSSLFNTTAGALLSANNRSSAGSLPIISEDLMAGTTLLIPLMGDKLPNLAPLIRAHVDPNSSGGASIPIVNESQNHSSSSTRRRVTIHKLGRIYIGLGAAIIALGVAMAVVFLVMQRKICRNKSDLDTKGDLELQQLTIVNPRQSKELLDDVDPADQDPDHENLPYTPHKGGLDTYSPEELRKATGDFNSGNFIEGTMFHGRLNGKNLAIKQLTSAETISKIDFELFQLGSHRHPNILRLLGTCVGTDHHGAGESYLVFEYAKNGSLKDWLHAGLAMKSQFIASCYCFLSWNQRLRICLHVAMALHYMHHTLSPSYIHGNVKSRNILLDEEFNAKLGNFGMSRCAAEDDDVEDHEQYLLSASWSKGYLCIWGGLVGSALGSNSDNKALQERGEYQALGEDQICITK